MIKISGPLYPAHHIREKRDLSGVSFYEVCVEGLARKPERGRSGARKVLEDREVGIGWDRDKCRSRSSLCGQERVWSLLNYCEVNMCLKHSKVGHLTTDRGSYAWVIPIRRRLFSESLSIRHSAPPPPIFFPLRNQDLQASLPGRENKMLEYQAGHARQLLGGLSPSFLLGLEADNSLLGLMLVVEK